MNPIPLFKRDQSHTSEQAVVSEAVAVLTPRAEGFGESEELIGNAIAEMERNIAASGVNKGFKYNLDDFVEHVPAERPPVATVHEAPVISLFGQPKPEQTAPIAETSTPLSGTIYDDNRAQEKMLKNAREAVDKA